MKRKKILVAACLTATLGGTFAFAARTTAAANWLNILTAPQPTINNLIAQPEQNTIAPLNNSTTGSRTTTQTQTQSASAQTESKDWVSYFFVFKFAGVMKIEAEKAEAEGRDAGEYKQFFVRRANLDAIQNQSFQEIAAACMSEVTEIDQLAQVIIDNERAVLKTLPPPAKGEPLPAAPPELAELEARRDASVRRHRDLLKASFGDFKFNEFEAYLKKEIAPKITTGKEQK